LVGGAESHGPWRYLIVGLGFLSIPPCVAATISVLSSTATVTGVARVPNLMTQFQSASFGVWYSIEPQWRTPETFDDDEALWAAVCEHELEGVAKRRSGRYGPGGRVWLKTKNKEYWRYEMEREGAGNVKRPRNFV
jgi:hypothetical protein